MHQRSPKHSSNDFVLLPANPCTGLLLLLICVCMTGCTSLSTLRNDFSKDAQPFTYPLDDGKGKFSKTPWRRAVKTTLRDISQHAKRDGLSGRDRWEPILNWSKRVLQHAVALKKPFVRYALLTALIRYDQHWELAAPLFWESLRRDPDSSVRAKALRGLLAMPLSSEAHLKALRVGIKDRSPTVNLYALFVLFQAARAPKHRLKHVLFPALLDCVFLRFKGPPFYLIRRLKGRVIKVSLRKRLLQNRLHCASMMRRFPKELRDAHPVLTELADHPETPPSLKSKLQQMMTPSSP
ncbi:MAG TPA: hypothetical protein DCE42_26340 [Myxococcales bacterium]|nr:hypothetical protein [Deltaproteobacteria bacterium]MBU48664.1 hypothetical protein [Deltaproteobacteria bacterium]MBU49823.1 hypothetical protein [Deltaproteobacteria bacterium]HAA58310.1 hypothetical protein [Myxococcales bacterium]